MESTTAPLPSINLRSGKLWFAHVHKAAGTSFVEELSRITHRPCRKLKCCDTTGSDLLRVRDWWFAPQENVSCSFHTNEDHVAYIFRQMHENRTGSLTNLATRSFTNMANNNDEPTLVTMYRDPIDQCRSSWAYRLRHCRMPTNTACEWCAYANQTFPNTAKGQLLFVQRASQHSLSRGFQRELNIHSAQASFRWIQNNVKFWGMSDLYPLSLCLLWFQAGLKHKLNSSLCSCEAERGVDSQTLVHANRAPPNEKNVVLNMSDEYIASFLRSDIELIQLLRRVFMQRVRRMEIDTGISMYNCT